VQREDYPAILPAIVVVLLGIASFVPTARVLDKGIKGIS